MVRIEKQRKKYIEKRSGSVKLVRNVHEAPLLMRPLMQAISERLALVHQLFIGAVCETIPGSKSRWHGLLLASQDPTATSPQRKSLPDLVADPRTICLLLFDESLPGCPGERWHLRIQDEMRADSLFLAPWTEELAQLLAAEKGATKAVTYLREARYYSAIADPHVAKLLDLSEKPWWTELYDSVLAQGLTPCGDKEVFLAVIKNRPKELFSAVFFFKKDEQERSILGALRRLHESLLLSEGAAIGLQASLHRDAHLKDSEASFDVRCEVSGPLRDYLVSLALDQETRPLSAKEESLLHLGLAHALSCRASLPLLTGLTSHRPLTNPPAPEQAGAVVITPIFKSTEESVFCRFSIDLAIVLEADSPHLLLSFQGPALPALLPTLEARSLLGSRPRGVDFPRWREAATEEMLWVVRRAWGVINALSMSPEDLNQLARRDMEEALGLKERAEEALAELSPAESALPRAQLKAAQSVETAELQPHTARAAARK